MTLEPKFGVWNRKGAKDAKKNKALNDFAFFVFFAVQLLFLA